MTEWEIEIGNEITLTHLQPAAAHLPLILSRKQIQEAIGDNLALQILYATGIRPAELPALTLREDGNLIVASRKNPLILADEETRQRLRELGTTPPLPDLPPKIHAHFQACGRRATLALFRHAFASRRLENGMDLFTLSDILDHQDLKTTEMYLPTALKECREAYLNAHPLLNPQTRIPTAILSPAEILTLIATPAKPLHRLVIRTLYATALREAELIALRYVDLGPTLFVRSGKGPKDRYTLMDPETLRLLQGDHPPDALLFPMTRMTVYNIVDKAAQASGLHDKYAPLGLRISPHTLRHAYATHCYQNGMQLAHISKLLGHAAPYETLLYINCSPEILATQYAQS